MNRVLVDMDGRASVFGGFDGERIIISHEQGLPGLADGAPWPLVPQALYQRRPF